MNEVTMFLFWLIVSMPAVCGELTSEGTPTTWGFRTSHRISGGACSAQRGVGLGEQALQDDSGGHDVADEPGGLAGEGQVLVPAPVQDGLNQLTAEFGAVDLLRMVAELVDERGPQAAWRAGPVRPAKGRHDPLAVRHLDGVERVGVEDTLLPFAGDGHLGRGEEAGAQAPPWAPS